MSKLKKVNKSRVYDEILNDGSTFVLSPRVKTIKYLNEVHGLTEQEYYNIVIHKDINYIHLCKSSKCNNSIPFYNLNRGYEKDTCNYQCLGVYRNDRGIGTNLPKCRDKAYESLMNRINSGNFHLQSKEVLDKINSDESRAIHRSEMKRINADKVSKGTHNFQKPEARIKSRYTEFLRKGDVNEICYFYVLNMEQLKILMMLIYGITDIQNKPSLIKSMHIAQIVDKRKNITLGYFISSKYEKQIKPLIDKIDRDEKLAKLKKLKQHEDFEKESENNS
jgi:hypothetical protein